MCLPLNSNVSQFISRMSFQVLSKAKAKEFKLLSSKKERDAKNLFLAEGEKCVRELLGVFKLKALICSAGWIDDHPPIAEAYSDKIFLTDSRGLEIISSLSTFPKVIGVFEKPEEEENLSEFGRISLLLDEVQDPGNLGTIIRTCDWFGVYDIYASRNTADAFSPKVVQATMGSLARVRVHYTDIEDLIKSHREIKVVGTLLQGTPLSQCRFPEKMFLIMGNEGRGISPPLLKLIDIPVTIPPVNPASHPDSLNVAIATAVILENIVTNGKN